MLQPMTILFIIGYFVKFCLCCAWDLNFSSMYYIYRQFYYCKVSVMNIPIYNLIYLEVGTIL